MRKPLPTVGPAPPGSLVAALARVPDPRQPDGRNPARPPLPLVGLWQFALAVILCGARSLYAMAQWGRERVEDDPTLLTELGLPAGRSFFPSGAPRVLTAATHRRHRTGWSGTSASAAVA
jgi:hypothetical protein